MKNLLIPLFILTFGAVALADPSAPVTESQKVVFEKKVEAAFKTKDVKAIEDLYCFDRTAASLHETLEKRVIPEMLKGEFVEATYSDVPPDAGKPYTLKGVTYSPNLPPLIALIVKFKAPAASVSFSTSGPSSITMILGIKDGSLWNVCAAPETHS